MLLTSSLGRPQTVCVDARIDLDAAAGLIAQHRTGWAERGIQAADTTWRDQGDGRPPALLTDRESASDPDSIGVTLRKETQEGSVVLFKGGWADFVYWDGESSSAINEALGWEDWLDLDRFAAVLDRLTALFH